VKAKMSRIWVTDMEAPERLIIPNDESAWLLDRANSFADCLPTQSLCSRHRAPFRTGQPHEGRDQRVSPKLVGAAPILEEFGCQDKRCEKGPVGRRSGDRVSGSGDRGSLSWGCSTGVVSFADAAGGSCMKP